MISSKLCATTNGNTSYVVSKLSRDIKAGRLLWQYHVVLDKAYPCMEQEIFLWKGQHLPTDKDALNYSVLLHWQVIEWALDCSCRDGATSCILCSYQCITVELQFVMHAGCTIFVFQVLFVIEYSRLALEFCSDSSVKLIIRLVTLGRYNKASWSYSANILLIF